MQLAAIAESPFQILQLYEYITINSIRSYKLIIRLNKNNKNNTQIKKTLELLFPESKNILQIESPSICFFLLTFHAIYSEEIVVGDENSIVYRLLRKILICKKTIFLDDGTATFTSQNRSSNRFTIFSDVQGKKNTLSSIKQLVQTKLTNSNIEEKIIFLGGKYCETNICNEETYAHLLRHAFNDIRKTHPLERPITYIPHRGEKHYKNILNHRDFERLNIEIIENHLPVELIGLEKTITVKGIYGFFSTALFSMPLIYPDALVKYYVVSESDLAARKRNILDLYEKLSKTSLSNQKLPAYEANKKQSKFA